MLEEPSVRELNGVHSSGTWMPSNSRNRTSRCRESYCSDVDLLPPLYTTVVADYHPDGNGDLSNLANKNQKQKRNVGDISCKPDGDDDGNLMSWLMKQFKENGLDKSNLANNNFEGLDMLHEFNGSNKVSTQQNSLQRTDSGSSISSFQGVGDSKKRKSQEESSMNNCLNRSRECYESKQQHHFPRMYPPLRDSSTESRRIHDGNRSDRFLTTANSTMTTPGSANSTMLLPKGNSKYQCKLINDLFHQITKKLGVLHDCDTQIIDELKNASRIIKDLQTRKPFTPSVSSVQYNQQYQSLFRPKASTPEFCRSSNSLRKKSVIKYFPKKRINNSGETFEFPEAENKQPYSISLPHSECQSSFEKDDRKSLFLNGLFTATSERRLIQRKFTESPWGPVSVSQANSSPKDFDHRPRITGQNSSHLPKNEDHSKWLKSSKTSVSTNNLDQSNKSIPMSNPSLRKSNLSNERSVSQSALPVYSSTMQSKTQASNTLNASAEISASENNSVKFITTKGIQSLFKLPFLRKASTPGPNMQLSHSLKFQGRSASLAQINVSNENSTIMSTSNDQLDKTIRNQNVPYIKPLLLKDLAKSKD